MSQSHADESKLSNIGILNKLFYDYNINRYGIISILLLFVGCGGGIAVGLGALEHVVQLVLVVLPTMSALAMILAVAPMRAIIYTSIFAVFVDVLIIVYNALV